MNSLELAARYSFMPNKLRFCGPKEANSIFLSFISKPSRAKEAELKKALSKFEALFPYLKAIAKANNKQPFDEEVIRAYWLGNELLENVGRKELARVIREDFAKPHLLPKKIAEALADSVPEGANAHHSFHVLHLQTITGVIEANLQNADNCRISVGRVKEVNEEEEKAVVSYKPIEISRGAYVFGKEKEKKVSTEILRKVKQGDLITIHWNLAVQKVDEEEARALEKYTLENMRAVKPRVMH
ncbi:MAG: DUF6390 family protein [Candidatus Micrarchaeota archaeon]